MPSLKVKEAVETVALPADAAVIWLALKEKGGFEEHHPAFLLCGDFKSVSWSDLIPEQQIKVFRDIQDFIGKAAVQHGVAALRVSVGCSDSSL
jgi:hypothetical protein